MKQSDFQIFTYKGNRTAYNIKKATFTYKIRNLRTSRQVCISQLMVFGRYIHDGKIVDDFLFCRGLTSRTTAYDVLKVVSDFFTTDGLSWENVVGICTDGAQAMLGSRFRFLKLAN